jgi:AAA domain, putative AbiEii toxin, Type IV TA system
MVAFEFPSGFRELRVAEERLMVDGQQIFGRERAQVRLPRVEPNDNETSFRIDWHLVALPIIQWRRSGDPVSTLRQWLANALILRPVPCLATGESESETLQPDPCVSNFGAWFSGLLASEPAAYTRIAEYLKQVMPDLDDIKNPPVGSEARTVVVQFSNAQGRLAVPFKHLSDGEKCFMIYALVIAANQSYGPLLCFWDEPDNFLAPFEVGPSIMALRRAFKDRGQLIATSHNPEAIRHFAADSTLMLSRNSRLEPTTVRTVAELREEKEFTGDFASALLRGDIGT